MTPKELKKKLKANGWAITQGKKHQQATNPDFPGLKVSITRGSGDIPKGTLDSILKETGLK